MRALLFCYVWFCNLISLSKFWVAVHSYSRAANCLSPFCHFIKFCLFPFQFGKCPFFPPFPGDVSYKYFPLLQPSVQLRASQAKKKGFVCFTSKKERDLLPPFHFQQFICEFTTAEAKSPAPIPAPFPFHSSFQTKKKSRKGKEGNCSVVVVVQTGK